MLAAFIMQLVELFVIVYVEQIAPVYGSVV